MSKEVPFKFICPHCQSEAELLYKQVVTETGKVDALILDDQDNTVGTELGIVYDQDTFDINKPVEYVCATCNTTLQGNISELVSKGYVVPIHINEDSIDEPKLRFRIKLFNMKSMTDESITAEDKVVEVEATDYFDMEDQLEAIVLKELNLEEHEHGAFDYKTLEILPPNGNSKRDSN